MRETRSAAYEKLMRGLPNRAEIKVGILDKGGDSHTTPDGDSGLTIGELAEIHEFGKGDNPQRSFIRDWSDERQAENSALLESQLKTIVTEGTSPAVALERTAVKMQASMVGRIDAGLSPENAQSTIDRKGSSKPLIHWGVLKGAIAAHSEVK